MVYWCFLWLFTKLGIKNGLNKGILFPGVLKTFKLFIYTLRRISNENITSFLSIFNFKTSLFYSESVFSTITLKIALET